MIVLLGALQFPQIGELVDWKHFGPLGFNKTILIVILSCLMTLLLFVLGGRKKALVPTGVQNLAETAVDFVADQIILQTIGEDGMVFLPYLTTLFLFILFCNIFEIIPIFQFPATARMAIPLFLAIITWLMYLFMGMKRSGPLHFFKVATVPPGVPKALLPLVAFIEMLQLIIVRPFSLAVRLFANMLAGHLLLATFALLTDALILHDGVKIGGFPAWSPLAIAPFAMDIGITAFEVLVAVLQAFIFTILTGVYLGAAMHPEH
ncbi:MAG: F0F1 ATP synthase subunit A [Acidimicrobiales bacterium]